MYIYFSAQVGAGAGSSGDHVAELSIEVLYRRITSIPLLFFGSLEIPWARISREPKNERGILVILIGST
jgi:hypothetical protein